MANQKIDIPQEACEPGKLNRRAVLTGTVATAAALAAAPLPADAAESPRDVIKRAGRELADALNHYDDGRWHALVYPSSKVENGLWLGNRMNVRCFTEETQLVELERKWRKAREAEDRACNALGKAEQRYFDMRGKFEHQPTPQQLFDAQREMKMREIGDKSHPVNAAIAAFHAGEQKRREAWEAEEQRASAESGHEKAEARHIRAINRTNKAFAAIMAKPARTIDGLRLKVRVTEEQCRHVEIDLEAWASIAADIMRGVDSVTG